MEQENNLKYEEAVQQLEQIVEKLENGDLSLDRAIEEFEKGISLIRFCNSRLDEAERKITKLVRGQDENFTEVEIELEGISED